MKNKPGKTVIVGAGVAGLTLAYQLSRAGREVVLVEREGAVGGLARSFKYDGFTFDVGPHRFHTDLPQVMDFIHEILEDDYLSIERRSGVWMFGRYFDWPLSPSSLLGMPLPVLCSVGADFLRRSAQAEGNFEDYIIGKYGRTLYEIFFKPYTEKFIGLPCPEVSSDWAVTGIDRAVIDKNLRLNDLSSLAKSLFASSPPLQFVYPQSGGISVFAEKISRKILANGGRILTGTEVTGIVRTGNRINKVMVSGEEHECDLLVWTASPDDLFRLLGYGGTGLSYLSLLLYNYRLDAPPCIDYQWCYFGSADIPFNRVSVPVHFNPALAPAGKSGICVEVTCRKGDRAWKVPGEMDPAIRKALAATGVIRDGDEISGLSVERIADAYPVYDLDYPDKVRKVEEHLKQWGNIKLLGRTGTFWYNNMDHSIGSALDLCRNISGQA